MISEEVQVLIEEGLAALSRDKGLSPMDMEIRASSLLLCVASLAQYRNALEHGLVKSNSISTGAFASAIHTQDKGKNITEKKLLAESDPTYVSSREKAEETESDITYLKTMIDVFKDGHIMWRQFCKSTE